MIDVSLGKKTAFTKTIGLDLLGKLPIPNGLIDELIHVPPGTESETAVLHKKDQASLLLQLFKVSLPGKPLGAAAKPPNLGIFMMSFKVDNLTGAVNRLKDQNIPILAGPIERQTGARGRTNAITVEGPDSELIEMFETLS